MKLTDILRQINEEEEDTQPSGEAPESYDFTIIPSDIQAALDALNNIKNYGIYSKNLANQSERTKVFGPSIPAQKSNAAQSDWNTLSPKERLLKIEEIKARVERISDGKGGTTFDNIGEKVWNNTLSLLAKSKDYATWMEENGDNPEDYLITLNGKQANDFDLFGSRGSAYFPQKLGDEEVKYKPLQQDENFIIVDNKIVFPLEKSPYKPKKYLRKVISLIMDNAGVDFEEDKKFQLEPEAPTQEPTPSLEPKPSLVTFKITLDPKKIRGNTVAIKNKIEGLKNTYDKNFDYSKNVLTITNIKPEKKVDLIKFFAPYKQTELTEGLDFDFEQYQMLRRAGIIK
jgi:hypothetical protein